MQLVYNGPHPEVVVDELDPETVIVAGQPVDIPDDLAARLLEQDTWIVPETPSQKKSREKAEADAVAAESAAQAEADAEAAKAAEEAATTAIDEGRVVEVPEPDLAVTTDTTETS